MNRWILFRKWTFRAVPMIAVAIMIFSVTLGGLNGSTPAHQSASANVAGISVAHTEQSYYRKAVELANLHETGLPSYQASLNTMFSYWYLTHVNPTANGRQFISKQTGYLLFAEFLKDTPAAIPLIKKMDAAQILNDQKANLKEGKVLLNQIESGTLSNVAVSTFSKGSSTFLLINLAKVPTNMLPSGVWWDDGVWLMVQISYFTYHAPWWLGGWSVNYGEHDTYNTLYAGDDAQQTFNSLMNNGWNYGTIVGIIEIILAVGLAWALPTLGVSVLASAIVAGAVAAAGVAVVYFASVVQSDFLQLYESTYANEPSGNKYLWTAISTNYYYPWVTVFGSLASTVSWYGYLSDGNTLSIFPSWATWVSLGYGSPIVAAISGYIHGIANQIGTNNWVYNGDDSD